MEHQFWHQKWQKNEIGFHEPEGNALLVQHASVLTAGVAPRVFVPLCGKTRDLSWLLSQGCDVVGCELNESAVEQLFAELDVTPEIQVQLGLKRFRHENLVVFAGDIFKLTKEALGPVTGIYDRAALVALPDAMRRQYSEHLVAITGAAPQLLITFAYDQEKMDGPPFSIDTASVDDLYRQHYAATLLQRTPTESGLKKIDADDLVFHLTPKAST